jgi:hypothetical protein
LAAGTTGQAGLAPFKSSRTAVPSGAYNTAARVSLASVQVVQLKQASSSSGFSTSRSISRSNLSPVACSRTEATTGKPRLE